MADLSKGFFQWGPPEKLKHARWLLDWFVHSAENGRLLHTVINRARCYTQIALKSGTTELQEEARKLLNEIDTAEAKYIR